MAPNNLATFYKKNKSTINAVLTVLILFVLWLLQNNGALLTPPLPGVNTAIPATSAPSIPTTSGPVAQGSLPAWLNVYFTDPNPPDNIGKGIDQYVQKEIDAAKTSIDVTSFDFNLPSLINALVSANKRGVKVRVVYDSENGNNDLSNDLTNNKTFDAIKTLTAAKVPLSDGGRTNGLMHDKMVIIDGKVLFMGSWNLSYNDTYRNNNNLLRITDPKIIANYQAKFNELFVDKRFGAKAEVKVPYPTLTIDGVKVENYFSPEDEVMAKLVSLVGGAKKTVHFIIFTYTHADLSSAMIARAKAGVQVAGVIENRGASQGALVPLFCAKLPVKTDGNKYTMHHKVIIIDGEIVITGSYNFTKSADDSNDDNVLVIHSPAVAALYEQEYQKLYAISETPVASEISCTK
jgi:phosphatidylserine/phosphatidylglycerophosphate/cardiolipin synthase-like enzyme